MYHLKFNRLGEVGRFHALPVAATLKVLLKRSKTVRRSELPVRLVAECLLCIIVVFDQKKVCFREFALYSLELSKGYKVPNMCCLSVLFSLFSGWDLHDGPNGHRVRSGPIATAEIVINPGRVV